jgi:hypothetical protein
MMGKLSSSAPASGAPNRVTRGNKEFVFEEGEGVISIINNDPRALVAIGVNDGNTAAAAATLKREKSRRKPNTCLYDEIKKKERERDREKDWDIWDDNDPREKERERERERELKRRSSEMKASRHDRDHHKERRRASTPEMTMASREEKRRSVVVADEIVPVAPAPAQRRATVKTKLSAAPADLPPAPVARASIERSKSRKRPHASAAASAVVPSSSTSRGRERGSERPRRGAKSRDRDTLARKETHVDKDRSAKPARTRQASDGQDEETPLASLALKAIQQRAKPDANTPGNRDSVVSTGLSDIWSQDA